MAAKRIFILNFHLRLDWHSELPWRARHRRTECRGTPRILHSTFLGVEFHIQRIQSFLRLWICLILLVLLFKLAAALDALASTRDSLPEVCHFWKIATLLLKAGENLFTTYNTYGRGKDK